MNSRRRGRLGSLLICSLPVDGEAVDAWVSSVVGLKNAEPVEKERPDLGEPLWPEEPGA